MKNISTFVIAFLVLSVFLFLGTFAKAQTDIWAIGTNFNFDKDPTETVNVNPYSDSIFYKIDPQTGIPMEIGTITGYTLCTGLDIHPITGEFFAVCDKIEENDIDPVMMEQKTILLSTMLLKIDETSGLPTEIGPLELSRSDFVSDISFRSDGVLFAHINGPNMSMAMENLTRTFDANKLGIINTQSGKFSALGDTGLEDAWSAIGFTEFDELIQCTDNTHSPGVANTLNQTNGMATFLADLIYPLQFVDTNTIRSKDFDLASGQFFGLLLSTVIWFPGDELEPFASTRNGAPMGTFLVTIDEDGDIALIGQTSGPEEQFGAITVLSKKIPTEVPTLSEWGLLAMAGILGIIGFMVIRRRKVTT